MDNKFGGIIWTNHAIARMKKRGLKQGDVWVTWRRPDNSRRSKIKGTWIYYKTLSNQKIEVVAKKNAKKEWIILAVWSRKVSDKYEKVEQRKSFGKSIIEKILGRKR